MAQNVDYVLVYQHPSYHDAEEDAADEKMEKEKIKMEEMRNSFAVAMREESLEIEEERVGKFVFVRIFCPLDRLYQEAESMRIEMPVHGLNIKNPRQRGSMIERKMQKFMTGDLDSDIQITAPFQKNCLDLFKTANSRDAPIWSSLRILLVYNILMNINIAQKNESVEISVRKGLGYLLMVGAFKDAFATHDPSSIELYAQKVPDNVFEEDGTLERFPGSDIRRKMKRTWGVPCRTQPIQLIRDYYGEKVAFYFAWVGTFITSLFFPASLGMVVFAYGLARKYTASTEEEKRQPLYYIEIIKNSSDNALTPYFAAIIILWGTILMEVWKRRQTSLAHQWHVEDFNNVEPDRPQFYGKHCRADPLTGLPTWHYPFGLKMLKYFTSTTVLLFMVMLVFISVSSVILYRVYMTVSFCKPGDGVCDLLHGTVLATFLNIISIMILGKVYEYIALKLTDWENHQTDSTYNDAFIIKLYAFQFANTYTSLFYTAFFRRDFGSNGIWGLGADHTDNCGDKENSNCMSMLSFQLLVLMIVKPIPKFLRDVIWPFLSRCFRRCHLNEIYSAQTNDSKQQHHLLREMLKPSVEDFRLGEFTEKMLQYGYLMMFAASFPLAPMLALLFNVMDLRIDARRLLWWNRRPTPFRDNDIGIWFQIINFINVCAVISNAFLIAFTSELGRDKSLEFKFAFVLLFEHFVFFMKFAVSLIIPDTPTWVKNSQRKERFLISYLMSQMKNPSDENLPCSTPNHHGSGIESPNGILKQDHDGERRGEKALKVRWSYG